MTNVGIYFVLSTHHFPNGPKKNNGPVRALDQVCNHPPV
jgi:hypothetical protein